MYRRKHRRKIICDACRIVKIIRESSQETSQKTPQKIIELVKEDTYITTQRMADLIGIDRSNIARAIRKMQSVGILRRVGPDKGGHWEIITTER